MPVTTAVVLGGGLGRRFGVLTSRDSPKALLPVANAPLLSYPVDWVASSGLAEALIVAGAWKTRRKGFSFATLTLSPRATLWQPARQQRLPSHAG